MKTKITLLGGGSGTANILSAIDAELFDVSCVLAMTDSGGSTGRLREEYDIPPVGDLRKIIAESADPEHCEILQHRFRDGSLAGHTVGNVLMLASLQKTNDLNETVRYLGKLYGCKVNLLPVSTEPHHLVMRAKDGNEVIGEGVIDVTEYEDAADSFSLRPHVSISSQVGSAIRESDVIILCPGSLHTSIFAVLAPEGMAEALQTSKAKKFFVPNICNQAGQTENYRIQDYVESVAKMLKEDVFDYVLVDESHMGTFDDDRAVFDTFSGEENIKDGAESGRNCGMKHDPHKVIQAISNLI